MTHLEGPLQVECSAIIVKCDISTFSMFCAIPVCPQLYFSLQQCLLAQRSWKHAQETRSEFIRGERAGSGEDVIEKFVEEDIDSS